MLVRNQPGLINKNLISHETEVSSTWTQVGHFILSRGKNEWRGNDQLLELTQAEWPFPVNAGLLHSSLLIRQLDSWGYWVEGGGDEPTQKEVRVIVPKLGLSALRR